jgi:6,7-dimethyl-8-ribityllumazine synthase
VKQFEGVISASSRPFVIVVSRWNEMVTKELLDGALDEFRRFSVTDLEVVRVPGSWEIPVAVRKILSRENPPAAIVALGCILQGQTPHAKLLGGDVAGALMSLQLQFCVPVAWGILTPDTAEQALDRAGMKFGNKGREAAGAAMEMASLLEQL